jgi:hypothetical protein
MHGTFNMWFLTVLKLITCLSMETYKAHIVLNNDCGTPVWVNGSCSVTNENGVPIFIMAIVLIKHLNHEIMVFDIAVKDNVCGKFFAEVNCS